MSAQFTPGPWSLSQHAKFGGTQMYWVNSETSVGTAVKADANLIAAAPDLYDALVAVVAVADRKTAEFDNARAALAKARGEQVSA